MEKRSAVSMSFRTLSGYMRRFRTSIYINNSGLSDRIGRDLCMSNINDYCSLAISLYRVVYDTNDCTCLGSIQHNNWRPDF